MFSSIFQRSLSLFVLLALGLDWFHILEVNFALFFAQAEDEFLSAAVKLLFDGNISNQFYIRPCLQIFNQLFCLLFKL